MKSAKLTKCWLGVFFLFTQMNPAGAALECIPLSKGLNHLYFISAQAQVSAHEVSAEAHFVKVNEEVLASLQRTHSEFKESPVSVMKGLSTIDAGAPEPIEASLGKDDLDGLSLASYEKASWYFRDGKEKKELLKKLALSNDFATRKYEIAEHDSQVEGDGHQMNQIKVYVNELAKNTNNANAFSTVFGDAWIYLPEIKAKEAKKACANKLLLQFSHTSIPDVTYSKRLDSERFYVGSINEVVKVEIQGNFLDGSFFLTL